MNVHRRAQTWLSHCMCDTQSATATRLGASASSSSTASNSACTSSAGGARDTSDTDSPLSDTRTPHSRRRALLSSALSSSSAPSIQPDSYGTVGSLYWMGAPKGDI